MFLSDALFFGLLAVLTYASLAFFFIIPLAAFFGFYHKKSDASRCFRTGRVVGVVAGYIALNATILFMINFANLRIYESAIAEWQEALGVVRAEIAYTRKNRAAWFPDALNDPSMACKRNAIAAYVDDRWKEIYKNNTCLSDTVGCSENEEAYFEAYLTSLGTDNMFNSLHASREVSNLIEPTRRNFNRLLSAITGQVESDEGDPDALADANAKKVYQGYIDNCAAFKAPPWAGGSEFAVSGPRLCFGRCS